MEGRVKRLKEKLANTQGRLDDLEHHLLHERKHWLRCDYCERVKHSSAMFSCSIGGHYVCEDHDSARIDQVSDICVICMEARDEMASHALVTLSGCLKRNRCHKDVYENIFIPLMKKMREDAWKNWEWDGGSD